MLVVAGLVFVSVPVVVAAQEKAAEAPKAAPAEASGGAAQDNAAEAPKAAPAQAPGGAAQEKPAETPGTGTAPAVK